MSMPPNSSPARILIPAAVIVSRIAAFPPLVSLPRQHAAAVLTPQAPSCWIGTAASVMSPMVRLSALACCHLWGLRCRGGYYDGAVWYFCGLIVGHVFFLSDSDYLESLWRRFKTFIFDCFKTWLKTRKFMKMSNESFISIDVGRGDWQS